MRRKAFIQKTFGALLMGIPIATYLSCSSSDSSDNNNGNLDPNPNASEKDCASNGAEALSISSNHGHTLVVSKEDIENGTERDYSIMGSSPHNHTVRLTSNHFNSLKSNDQIVVTSTTEDGHSHSVTVACA
ncbi:hypothetical protein [Flagellimonas sp. GZD32]|uniref:hypothetical protein n=1 Tax=Flagellimonas cixiensis TaxID=3228750 RepID=UPI0035C8F02D